MWDIFGVDSYEENNDEDDNVDMPATTLLRKKNNNFNYKDLLRFIKKA